MIREGDTFYIDKKNDHWLNDGGKISGVKIYTGQGGNNYEIGLSIMVKGKDYDIECKLHYYSFIKDEIYSINWELDNKLDRKCTIDMSRSKVVFVDSKDSRAGGYIVVQNTNLEYDMRSQKLRDIINDVEQWNKYN